MQYLVRSASRRRLLPIPHRAVAVVRPLWKLLLNGKLADLILVDLDAEAGYGDHEMLAEVLFLWHRALDCENALYRQRETRQNIPPVERL